MKIVSRILLMAFNIAFIVSFTACGGNGNSNEEPTNIVNGQKTTYSVNGVSFNMVSVAGDTFQMGETIEQIYGADDREKPVHSVILHGFMIGETEVTQALWYAVMGEKPTSDVSWTSAHGLGDNFPSYSISWNECQEFIKKLNKLTGENFRMPTEAEWEYAARGGKDSKGYRFAGGNAIDDVAWYYSNTCYYNHPGSQEVATKTPNELGLYDMSGNVYEWCADWYGDYSSKEQTNPTGPSAGLYRIYRGGGWYDSPEGCRIAARAFTTPDNRFSTLGLRLAK